MCNEALVPSSDVTYLGIQVLCTLPSKAGNPTQEIQVREGFAGREVIILPTTYLVAFL